MVIVDVKSLGDFMAYAGLALIPIGFVMFIVASIKKSTWGAVRAIALCVFGLLVFLLGIFLYGR
jgi:hypothetical protein